MSPASSTPPAAGSWRVPRFRGLFFDDFVPDSAWIREAATLRLPPGDLDRVILRGEFRPHPRARGLEAPFPTLTCLVDGRVAHVVNAASPGRFELAVPIPPESARRGPVLMLQLGGVRFTNILAWLGRVAALPFLQRFRGQHKNRQLRIHTITTPDGETIFDFAVRLAPFSLAFARRHTRAEFNIAGFFTADLGVGESARCMVRAADAAGIATALVPLKLNSKNRLGDPTYAARLQETNPHRVNVLHIDAPASPEIPHHHGAAFLAGKYNIAYWAWELPEFPDAWVSNFAYFDEVWAPSQFTATAIAMKSPLPVLAMPHAISFRRPAGDPRARFGLPPDKFLFLFLCDLNSYAARKNPQAVVAAFHASGLAGRGAALVVKVHNSAENPADFAALQAAVSDLPDTTLITGTLARDEIYALEAACDCFVSLHRAEGFGLAVAECMYLGKPVISTDWSGTTEFVTAETGCPVRYSLVPIRENTGPYGRGQAWAEPDIGHAAEWMQRLFADRALAASIGAAGRTMIETHFSPAAIGARYRRRLESIATF